MTRELIQEGSGIAVIAGHADGAIDVKEAVGGEEGSKELGELRWR